MPRKMKESGVEWFGQIPEGWGVNLVFQVADQVKSKNEGLREQNLLSLSYGKIKRKSIETAGGLLPQSFDGYNIIESDDIVLRLTDLQNDKHSLRVGISSERGIITSAYTTLRPRTRETAQYLYYSLHTFDLVKGFYGMGSGVRQGLNYDEVKLIKLPRPSAAEQQRIAAFLDERCAKIDGMIAEAKASIEDYKKWKQSIIFEAVTGKHEKNLKPSGVDWIGDVPEGWKVCRIKDVAQIRTGSTPDKTFQREYYSPEVGVPWIKAENLGTIYPISNTTEFLTEQGVKEGRVFPANTVFVCCIASVGKVGYSNVEASCNQQINGLIFNALMDWKYGFYVMLGAEEEYNVRSSGNVVRILNSALQSTINIPIPQILEQRRIAAELDGKCAAIDKLVGEKEALIADLEAYKKSLIFETVTGKREVA